MILHIEALRKIPKGILSWQFSISQLANFHDVKKIDTHFRYNTFVANISQQGTFFQEYIEIELKIYFIMFEGLFEWQI